MAKRNRLLYMREYAKRRRAQQKAAQQEPAPITQDSTNSEINSDTENQDAKVIANLASIPTDRTLKSNPHVRKNSTLRPASLPSRPPLTRALRSTTSRSTTLRSSPSKISQLPTASPSTAVEALSPAYKKSPASSRAAKSTQLRPASSKSNKRERRRRKTRTKDLINYQLSVQPEPKTFLDAYQNFLSIRAGGHPGSTSLR